MADKRDYFEINVDGTEEVNGVINRFDHNYLLIANSLRIMNDVMVLLNPKIILKQLFNQT